MITRILNKLRPGASFSLNGDSYGGIIWHDTVQTKPSQAEVDAARADIEKDILKQKVSAKRYDVETAGINFTYRTVSVPVSTARASQDKIDAARNMVRDNAWVDGSVWKFADNVFRPMTAAEITDMCTAVRTHIKACFDNEKSKFDEINATGTTDVNTGWPATVGTPTTIYFNK